MEQVFTMNDGHVIPSVALGVYQSHEATEAAVLAALKNGYRHIDTAAIYGNEEAVGTAIRKSGIPRSEIFVTTKVWNTDIRAGRTREALMTSLKKLQMDYVDLLLLHWPTEGRIAAYKEMERMQKEGLVRSIGVSNFRKHHLEELMANTSVKPAADQMEFNPQFQDNEVLAFCRKENILLEAWSPLGRGASLGDETIQKLGKKYGKSSAQIILRWLNQKDIVVLPKSVHENRIIENHAIFNFALSDEDMAVMDRLNRGTRIGPDPDHFSF
ncbi:MAG: aldo/keto reductase [Solobacterium sp.]|jgi:diketogulonate reductase-like aldo/keto reductase|nr:aldo/keto reductase [Solobacterium sp.]MCH4048461.1 aldo/keto reductase [Solobacterium sp.]MCH4074687.1 aldo/keto reductase [Solobacterium sp.]